jgi:5'-deoxynucleotidase YfbR-like HD superfamily hydrolase
MRGARASKRLSRRVANSASKPTAAPMARAWQRMLSGRRLDLLDPSPLDIEIEDIAHGLARVARWNGQTQGSHIFSVAQHSVLVEAVARVQTPRLDRPVRLAVLLHDAPEYVIGDMISPFKAVLGDAYKATEARLLAAIHIRFGLAPVLSGATLKRIKAADQGAAYLEATRLAGFSDADARGFFGEPPALPDTAVNDHLEPWPAREAQARFLARFKSLAGP